MKIALIGFGNRIGYVAGAVERAAPGRIHWVGWSDPLVEPAGLRSFGPERFCDGGRSFGDHRSMLDALRPDAVLIGSPNHCHLEHLRDALSAGCRVFVEKPVVIDPEESWQAAELLQRYGQDRFLVGLVLRSSPLFRTAMRVVSSGRIGRPVSIEANELLLPEHGAFIARDWRRRRAFSGSHILEKCCHDLDLIQALLGGRVLRTASFGGRSVFVPEHAHWAVGDRYGTWRTGWSGTAAPDAFTADGDILDHQVCVAEVEGGARLGFHCNNHNPWQQRRWLLCGTEGAWESDLATGRWRVQRAYGAEESGGVDDGGGHYGADDAMAAALVATWFDRQPFPVPTRAAIEAGLAAMGVDAAQRAGRVVELGAWWRRLDGILGQPAILTDR